MGRIALASTAKELALITEVWRLGYDKQTPSTVHLKAKALVFGLSGRRNLV